MPDTAPRRSTVDQLTDDALDALYNDRDALAAAVARGRALAEDMRTWCSPHGVAADYAQQVLTALTIPENQ